MTRMFGSYKHLPRSYVAGTLIRRREDPEYATEVLHELGTTDVAIGDATAEIMMTTIGKIPNEMYELEENTVGPAMAMAAGRSQASMTTDGSSVGGSTGFAAHSTLFTVLTVALLLLLLVCCVAACVIARARRRFFESSGDAECDPDCSGAKRPLISSDKLSDSTSRSSAVSERK